MVRWALMALAVLILVAGGGPAGATPQVAARDSRLSVMVDPLPATPYQGEMILVTVRGLYDLTIALETLEQPELRNFGWMQLGRDKWTSQRIDGRQMTVFERRLALYPGAAGTLTIGPFTHRLTLISGDGERFVHNVVSEPVTITIAPKPVTEAGWWLPARSITYSDTWDKDPAMLASNETATRTVRIEAKGVPPGSLPPPPKMRAPWLISFIAPEQRSVELTEDGPVSTVVWEWRMRPVSSEPGRLEAFHIPWFDTTRRQMRDVVLKSQRIAFAAIADPPEPGGVSGLVTANAVPLAAFGSFLASLALLLPGRRLRSRAEILRRLRPWLPDLRIIVLRRAAVRGDARAVRFAVHDVLRNGQGGDSRKGADALARLDRHLYGPPPVPELDLKALTREVLAARRQARNDCPPHGSYASSRIVEWLRFR